MPLNLDSHSSLGRWKRQHGASRGKPNSETIPSYIKRCQLKREILDNKDLIVARLQLADPVEYNRIERTGFDPMVMTISDHKFNQFVELVERLGIVEAYITVFA